VEKTGHTAVLEHKTSSNKRNIRQSYSVKYKFKKGSQLRTNIVKENNGVLFTDSHNILN